MVDDAAKSLFSAIQAQAEIKRCLKINRCRIKSGMTKMPLFDFCESIKIEISVAGGRNPELPDNFHGSESFR